MSDKHEAKQKAIRAKAHTGQVGHKPDHVDESKAIESEIKAAAGNVQEELTAERKVAGHAHTH